MNQVQQSFLSNLQTGGTYFNAAKAPGGGAQQTGRTSFGEILAMAEQVKKDTPLKFSKHATGRLLDRNIEMTTDQMDRLTQGARKAGAKGIRDSLVMVDNLAFIVNVPNNTVITALDQEQADEKIFTNIDGAVFA